MYLLQAAEETALPIEVVGWTVLVLSVVITAAWLWYLYR